MSLSTVRGVVRERVARALGRERARARGARARGAARVARALQELARQPARADRCLGFSQ